MPEGTVTLETIQKDNEDMKASISQIGKTMDEILKSKHAPFERKPGASALSSQPFQYSNLLKALHFKTKYGADSKWRQFAKNELALTEKIQKSANAINPNGSVSVSEFCSPYSAALMCKDWKAEGVDGGENIPGFPAELVKEVEQNFNGMPDFDPDEAAALGLNLSHLRLLRKADDQRYDTATLGGVLGAPPGRGELIDLLRPNLLFGQAPGVRFVPLGVSGSMEYPRHTGATSIAATTEGQSTPKSNVTFGMLRMDAKQYTGLAQYTEQMMRFAGNPMIEAFLRMDMTQSAAQTIDLDSIIGQGGIKILGITNIPGKLTHNAATAGTDGDTLGTNDPSAMVAEIRMQNVPGQVYFGVLPSLWQAILTRKDAVGQYVFQFASANGSLPPSLHGTPALDSTNIPQNRVKGAGDDLTMLIAFVPSQLMIGQAGVVDFAVTNAHDDNFARGISTIRMSMYTDLGVRYPQAINICDKLVVQ